MADSMHLPDIDTRKREGAYESLVKDVNDLVSRINVTLVQMQAPLR